MKIWYDYSPYKHHKRKWMPLILHCLIELVTVKICNLFDPNRERKAITICQHLILGCNTAFPSCCVAWFIIDEIRGFVVAKSIRERAGVDIALAIDDFWSGYSPCPKCAAKWLNDEYFEKLEKEN